ncbi:hypothetical protein WICPIJ_007259 [Wickerhamomyces pijperi]|uniref:Uncharacterized protein n=1 Tax=Wickerhamomyces pijperi TaxID=599730 RepID=A0A9P8Q2V2_WICPI|nr:hypothetical protein WICPIJ_007259 [Wickerhamomyces pijperi]
MLKTNKSALSAALIMFGSACKLTGNWIPGKYLTFSCLVLMISVKLTPLIFSSKTHMSTSLWNKCGLKAAFSATTLAMVVPQLPEPITVTLYGLTGAKADFLDCSLLVK